VMAITKRAYRLPKCVISHTTILPTDQQTAAAEQAHLPTEVSL
jgi:hypothetical protein